MKLLFKNIWVNIGFTILLFTIVFYACKPDSSIKDLAAKPTADFTVVPGADANTVILVNKTSSSAVAHWFENTTGQRVDGKDSATMHFTFAGTYKVTLMAAGNGGIDSVSKQVTISQNDPNACNGTAIGFITGCGTKTWKLNPEANAYQVAPGPNSSAWWGSTAGDVTARSCEFNDTYTFTFNAAGTFAYDNKGDFYPDGYLGDNGYACESNSNFKPNQTPWGSGNFQFVVIPNGGAFGLGQLKVIGLGAHIGLQKVNNGGEITSGPVGSITYDIFKMEHDAVNNYDKLVLAIHMPSDYWWTFTLRSF